MTVTISHWHTFGLTYMNQISKYLVAILLQFCMDNVSWMHTVWVRFSNIKGGIVGILFINIYPLQGQLARKCHVDLLPIVVLWSILHYFITSLWFSLISVLMAYQLHSFTCWLSFYMMQSVIRRGITLNSTKSLLYQLKDTVH